VKQPPIPVPPKSKRPPLQLTIWGLMVLMLGCSVTAALAYYMRLGMQSEDSARLVGMIVVLAGPLLLMTAISLLLALTQWLRQR
jgi:hypothetical protein